MVVFTSIWRIPEEIVEEDLLSGNTEVLRKIQPSLPINHTRATRKQFFNQVSLFSTGKPAVLRAMYKQLTGKYLTYLWWFTSVWII